MNVFQKERRLHDVGRLFTSGTPYCSLGGGGDHGARRGTPNPRDQLWARTHRLSTKPRHPNFPQQHLRGKASIYIYIYIEKYIFLYIYKNLYIYVVISAAIFTPINNKFFVYCYYFLVFMFSKSERWPDICQMLVGPHWGGALQAE